MHSGCPYRTCENAPLSWYGCGSTDSEWKWEVLLVASCSHNFTFTHTHTHYHLRAPRTRRLTTRSDHAVASGKESSLVTHAGFCCFPMVCEWFSCLLRDTYKKVRGATLCISSNSFEKHLLTWKLQLFATSDSMKQLVFCLFAVCSWCLADMSSVSDRIWQKRKLQEVRKELKVVRQMLQVGSLARSLLVLCTRCSFHWLYPLCAHQNSEMMLTTPPENIEVRKTFRLWRQFAQRPCSHLVISGHPPLV